MSPRPPAPEAASSPQHEDDGERYLEEGVKRTALGGLRLEDRAWSISPDLRPIRGVPIFEPFVVLDKNFAADDPEKAGAITKALIRRARWAGENPEKAAGLAIGKGYWARSKEDLVAEIARYMWMPGLAMRRSTSGTTSMRISSGAFSQPAWMRRKLLKRYFCKFYQV